MVDQKAKSLADLLIQKKPKIEEVLATFDNYATIGAAILFRSVQEIVDKTHMTVEQLEKAATCMRIGHNIQYTSGHKRDAKEYASALGYINNIINSKRK